MKRRRRRQRQAEAGPEEAGTRTDSANVCTAHEANQEEKNAVTALKNDAGRIRKHETPTANEVNQVARREECGNGTGKRRGK